MQIPRHIQDSKYNIMPVLKELLRDYKVILASASPRRYHLLEGLGIDFSVEFNGNVTEEYDTNIDPLNVPLMLSVRKSHSFHREVNENEIIITADTLVICDADILEKPQDRDEAFKMIRRLSGRSHIVSTGVTLRSKNKETTFSAETEVWFKEIDDEEINYYLDNYSPYDKAGSYGAQDWLGYTVIKRIEGSYFNVVGLPVQKLNDKLKEFVLSLNKEKLYHR